MKNNNSFFTPCFLFLSFCGKISIKTFKSAKAFLTKS